MDCCKTKNNDGCCKDLPDSYSQINKIERRKIKMKRNVLLWIVIGALFIMSLFLVFKAGSINSGEIQAISGVAQSASSSSGMVGGC